MKTILTFVVLLFSFSIAAAADLPPKVLEDIQDVSVTVRTGWGTGSGFIKTRQREKDYISYVFTAAHVVKSLRNTRKVIDNRTGTERTIVEFDDAKIIKTLIENGRTVGKMEIFAEVVRYNWEEDLALLRIRQKNFTQNSVQFYLDTVPVGIGTNVFHIGSFLGEQGSASLSLGVVSQVGRLLDREIFDQVSATGFPGSSGGGVYLYDGRLMGQVLRGAGETFVLVAPARRIVKWAKSANIEWAVNDKVSFPSDTELKKIPIEDNGVVFTAALPDAKKPAKVEFKTMEYINGNE